MWKLHAAGLIPKLKLPIVFFQAVLSLKRRYGVDMPLGYDKVMTAAFSWAEYNKLSRLVIPGGATACLCRRLLRAVAASGRRAPCLLCGPLSAYFGSRSGVALRKASSRPRPAFTSTWQAEDSTRWVVLFASFFLCPGASAEVFAAWTCPNFVVDSDTLPPTTLAYRYRQIEKCVGTD